MKQKFTPGPWIYDPEIDGRQRGFIRCNKMYPGAEKGMAICRLPFASYSAGEVAANARLICAAPKMFAALQALIQWHENPDDPDEAWMQARDAIAEAEGK